MSEQTKEERARIQLQLIRQRVAMFEGAARVIINNQNTYIAELKIELNKFSSHSQKGEMIEDLDMVGWNINRMTELINKVLLGE